MDCSVSLGWEALFATYVSGDVDLKDLYQAAKRPMERIVARFAPTLPEDLREDVVQQVFLRLLQNPPQYDPKKCTVRTFAFGLLRNAARQVHAMFAPPGERTRMPKEEPGHAADQATSEAMLDDDPEIMVVEDHRPVELDEAASPRWTAAHCHAHAEANELLSRMAEEVAAAAWLIYAQDYSIVDAARALSKSRFALTRVLHHAVNSEPCRRSAMSV